jgi:hypothetical protein
MNYGQKYNIGDKCEAKIVDGAGLANDLILRGRIVKIEGGCYHVDWGDMGIYQYNFYLLDKPNDFNSITVIPDTLPEDLT